MTIGQLLGDLKVISAKTAPRHDSAITNNCIAWMTKYVILFISSIHSNFQIPSELIVVLPLLIVTSKVVHANDTAIMANKKFIQHTVTPAHFTGVI